MSPYWHFDFSSEKFARFIFFQFSVITALRVCVCDRTPSVCVHLLDLIHCVCICAHLDYILCLCVFILTVGSFRAFASSGTTLTGLGSRDLSSTPERKRKCTAAGIVVKGNYTATCSLSIPLSRLSGPYLALMRCGNTHTCSTSTPIIVERSDVSCTPWWHQAIHSKVLFLRDIKENK